MSPRGTGFIYLAPALRERLRPSAANCASFHVYSTQADVDDALTALVG